MTYFEITSLLQARNNICITASILDIPADTRSIDVLLSTVPAGRDNRVDLALGRSCAVLPERIAYDCAAARVVEALDRAAIADMEQRTAETANEPPTYDGMWM